MLPAAPAPVAPVETHRRIAALVAVSVLLFPLIPGQAAAGVTVPWAERFGLAGAWIAYAALISTVPAVRRRAGTLFDVALYATGLWAVRAALADAFSPGSVLFLVMATFGLGLGFRDADRLARFYLSVLGAIGLASLLSSAPMRTEPTLVLAVVAAIMAIAYQVARARDEALREASVLALVASHVHNGVVMTDPKGRITWINEGFTRQAGRALPDVVARDLPDTLLSPPTPAADLARLRRALADGRAATLECARRRPDGSVLWVALELAPVLDEGGAVERFIAVETDVTAAHAYVAEIQDAMEDLLFVLLPDGTVRSANRAASDRLGVGPDELAGVAFADFLLPLPSSPRDSLPPEAVDAPTRQLLSVLADPDRTLPVQGVEVALRTADGRMVPVHVTTSALPAVGDLPRRTVLVARDITERRRLEAERVAIEKKAREAQKLESLGVLAGGVAHDFNNLLVGVLGNTSLLREELPAEPRLSTLVDRIEDSAQRAAELTRQMLAYSGRGRFVIERVNLSSLAEDMRRLFGAVVSKRATLSLELAADLPSVEGDVTQLRQVLLNLLTNASDALGGGDGTITLRTAAVEASRALLSGGVLDDDLPPGRYVLLEVGDSGAGMSDNVRKRMFDPFFTTKGVGRGLGLAATLGVIRGHRGAIRVTSSPGKGAVVSILLPVAAPLRVDTPSPSRIAAPSESPPRPGRTGVPTPPLRAPAADRPPASAPSSAARTAIAGARVLVADDEPAVLEFVAQVLRQVGAEVVTARDGLECVERFKERPGAFSLVILDLTMPRMTGEEALAALREIRPGVPVLLSSGYSEQEATSRFAGAGLAGFLQKPYRARQLLAQAGPLLQA